MADIALQAHRPGRTVGETIVLVYELEEQVRLAKDAHIIAVEPGSGGAFFELHVLCDPNRDYEVRHFASLKPGEVVPTGSEYVATVRDADDMNAVYHIFERMID